VYDQNAALEPCETGGTEARARYGAGIHKRRARVLALFALAMFGASTSASTPAVSLPGESVHFALEPDSDGAGLTALRVKVRFRANASGTTDFGWDGGWAGERRLWQWARGLSVTGADAVEHNGDGHWRIRSVPGTELVVSYRIVSAFDHDPTIADTAQAKPVIRPRWFYAVGSALFGRPDDSDDAPATFDWSPSSGIAFASDLEHLAGRHRAALRPGTVTDVLESIAIGGRDVRLFQPEATSGVRVATVGRYAFQPEQLDRLVRSVIDVERTFWNADKTAPFLVTLAPIKGRDTGTSFSGTGRTDAFALWVDERTPLHEMKWLLAHEYFHSWNPSVLGAMPREQAEWPTQYWMSEGFTDYYARALLVRAGLISASEFVAQWNDMLAAYANSPMRTTAGDRVAAAFWEDASAQKIPYQRGAMLAAIWNARLLRKSRGTTNLDSVLRSHAAEAKTSKEVLTSLFRAVAARNGLDVSEDEARYTVRGDPILMPADTFGACATVVTEERPVFMRGYDAQATFEAGNFVSGIDPLSSAYVAGLRNGMRIVARIRGKPYDVTTPFVLKVEDAGRTRTISYRPQGRERVRVQRIELSPHPSPGCATALGGLGPAARRERHPHRRRSPNPSAQTR